MKKINKAVAAVLTPLLLSACSQNNENEPRLIESYLQEVIQPEYSRFIDSSKTLQSNATAFCSQPDETRFRTLRDQWRTTMGDWQRAEAVGQIYLEDNMDGWRFQFWPDKKNLVGRKVEQLLTKELPDTLGGESVIVQGLSALEYLIFDPKAGSWVSLGSEQRCALLQTVSRTMVENATSINHNWYEPGEFYLKITSTEPDKQVNVPVLVLNSLDVLVSRLIREINLPLGKSQANHYLAESWRSGQSLTNLSTSLDMAQSMIDFVKVNSKSSGDEWSDLQTSMRALKGSLDQLPASFALAHEQYGRDKLLEVSKELEAVRGIIQKASTTLNIPLGFNASDGD